MATWTANFQYLENFTIITSNVRMRIDAFEGTRVRGAIFGVFDVPGQGASGHGAHRGRDAVQLSRQDPVMVRLR